MNMWSLTCSTFVGTISSISHRDSYSSYLVIISRFSYFAISFQFYGANVNVKVSVSSIQHASSGVPQGSILGSLLLLIYFSDITDLFPGADNIKFFANDIKIHLEITDFFTVPTLQNSIDDISSWATTWQLN